MKRASGIARRICVFAAAALILYTAFFIASCGGSGNGSAGGSQQQGGSGNGSGNVAKNGSQQQGGSSNGAAGEDMRWQESLADSLAAASTLPGFALPGTPAAKDRADENGRTWYQVFVYSFCDSNGDGIGDLNGVAERLDYICGMGFDGIWLSPVHPSETYHKYDVDDYYAIDPAYGTMDDFDKLVAACDELGLKILLDLVINHTSIDHPWFKQHPEYYHIQDAPGNGQWKQLPSGKYYECRFWDRMPDLNLENPGLRDELGKVVKFWFDKGVSGFRLDAVKEYETGDDDKNIEILKWLNGTAKAAKPAKPAAYLVGENWTTDNSLYAYYKSGIDSFFDFQDAGADGLIAKTLFQSKAIGIYLGNLVTAWDQIKRYNPGATAAPFFTNHDNPRAAGFLRRDENLIKTAWGMSLMQPGDAFVYYGEELGMSGSGKDENKRAPMYWTSESGAPGMTSGPPGMEAQQNSFPPAISQVADEASIYSYVRKAVLLRAKYPEIGRGDIAAATIADAGGAADGAANSGGADDAKSTADAGGIADTGGATNAGGATDAKSTVDAVGAVGKLALISGATDSVGALIRTWNGVSSIVTIYNVSPEEAVLTAPGRLSDYLSATGAEPKQDGGTLTLPGYSIAIMRSSY